MNPKPQTAAYIRDLLRQYRVLQVLRNELGGHKDRISLYRGTDGWLWFTATPWKVVMDEQAVLMDTRSCETVVSVCIESHYVLRAEMENGVVYELPAPPEATASLLPGVDVHNATMYHISKLLSGKRRPGFWYRQDFDPKGTHLLLHGGRRVLLTGSLKPACYMYAMDTLGKCSCARKHACRFVEFHGQHRNHKFARAALERAIREWLLNVQKVCANGFDTNQEVDWHKDLMLLQDMFGRLGPGSLSAFIAPALLQQL